MAGVKKQDDKESSRSQLRAEAEKKVARSAPESALLKKQDLDKLVHELQVHQVELEMQNEELRGAQEQIAKSRNDYADLYDYSPVGYFTFNGDALITGVNLTGAALLGVERQKLLKRRFRQFVAPADTELWNRHFVSVLQQGEKQIWDLLLRRGDGSTLHARLDSIRVEMDDGTFEVRTGMGDITIQKQTEEALKESEEINRRLADYYKRLNDISITFGKAVDPVDLFSKIAENFRLITDSIAASFAVYDQEAQALKVMSLSIDPISRDSVISMFGTDLFKLQIPISTDDLKQMLTQSIRRPKDLHELSSGALPRDISDSVMDAIGCRQIVALAISHDGEILGTCVAYLRGDQPVVPDEALKTYISLSGLAIKRKQEQEALRESEEQFRLSLENAPDGVYMNDLEGNFLYGNFKCEELLGYKREELIGKNFLELNILAEDSLARAAEILQDNINGKSTGPDELKLIRKDGRLVPVEINTSVVRRGGQNVVLAFARDITERKRAEDSLRSEQLMLARTEGIAHVGSWEWEIATDTVTWSEELFRIFQRDPQKGAPSFAEHPALYHPDDFALLNQAAEAAVADGTPYELELRAIRNDGETRVCVARGVAEMGPGGRTVRLFGSLQDITERKLAEEVLREVEISKTRMVEKLNEAQHLAMIGSWEWNLQTDTVWWSDETYRIFGVTQQDFTPSFEANGKFIHPDDFDSYGKSFEHSLQTGEPLDFHVRLVTKDGLLKHCIALGKPIYDDSHKPVRFVGSIMDITEHKRSEVKLQQSEVRFRELFSRISSGVAVYEAVDNGTDFIFKDFNPAAEKIEKVSSKDILGKRVTEAFPGVKVFGVFEIFQRVWRTGEPEYFPENIYRDGRDAGSWRESWVFKLPSNEIVAVYNDVTERKSAEEKLEKSYESLKKTLYDAINTMVKIVELRDPYTAGHQQKVADLATAIAREMKFEDTQIDQLRTAAVIHDIGKIYVPSDILSKPGKLTDIELSLIRTHAQNGYDIVKGMELPGAIAETILQHHERLDGSGYPNGLKAEDTLMKAKILAVADVVEAMASHRPYRSALGIDKALEEISKNKGKLYDPDVVDACTELFKEKGFKIGD